MNNTPKAKGFRTAIQSFIGFFVALMASFLATIWGVPGVPEATMNFLWAHLPEVLAFFGIPLSATAGAVAWYQNKRGL